MLVVSNNEKHDSWDTVFGLNIWEWFGIFYKLKQTSRWGYNIKEMKSIIYEIYPKNKGII